MPRTQNHLVMKWIASFGALAALLVVYGGFVRLTRAGLSIVEWNPVGGAVPPLTEQAWQAEFSKYQRTPEFQQINSSLTIGGYKEIFWIEWIHRLLARLAGLVFALPFFMFLLSRRIPWNASARYVLIGLLFLLQALMGWIMVSSGLVGRPSVSHFLLAAHLFLALSLIGASEWTFLDLAHGRSPTCGGVTWSAASVSALFGLVVLLLQMAFGAFTAGLKAGHVSNTWPLMLGRLIPSGLLSQSQPALFNLVAAPLTVAFVHRWLALAALVVAAIVYVLIGRARVAVDVLRALRLACVLVLLQFILGIAVVLTRVGTVIALLHQMNAIALFVMVLYLLHRLRNHDRGQTATRV